MDTRGPLVSVIIPAYNAGRYIAETLDSILSQSYRAFEVIVVDDGSTDNTREIVEGYGPRVVYVYQDNSGAPARPRNVGIARACGKYVCFFDSDDVMLPEKLSRSVAFIERHPELGLVFTNFIQFTEEGDLPGLHLDRYSNFQSLPKTKLEEGGYRLDPEVAFESLFFGNYIGTSSVLVPAHVLKEVGGFDEEVSPGGLEDRDMWFRIARRYPFGFLDIVGHRYRIRPEGVSKRALRAAEARLTVTRRYLDNSLSRRTRRQAHRLIADSAFTIGYQLCLAGMVTRARKYFGQSIAARPTPIAVRWWMLSLLGDRGVQALRRVASAASEQPKQHEAA